MQIASLNQAVVDRDAQISKMDDEMRKIKQSTSWRITSPLRVAKNLVISPKRTTYSIIRSLFWKLPAGLRQANPKAGGHDSAKSGRWPDARAGAQRLR